MANYIKQPEEFKRESLTRVKRQILKGAHEAPPIVMPNPDLYKKLYGSSAVYPRPHLLKQKIDEYFQICEIEEKPLTVAGLTVSLGFKNIESFKSYAKKGEEYETIVETAITRIEAYKNELLLKAGKNVAGVIVDLKHNHKWSDRMQVDTTVAPGGSLAALLDSMQGQVLKPKILESSNDALPVQQFRGSPFKEPLTYNDGSVIAEFEEVPSVDDLL